LVDNFGVCAGEGLAAVRGHQSGGEGAWAAMPAFSLGDRSNRIIRFRFPAPTPFSFRSQQAATLPMRRARRALGRAAKMAAFPVSAARSASAPYQLED